MSKDVENKTYLRQQIKKLQNELWTMGIKPINNTNENMIEKKPQSGMFLFLTIQYFIKGNFKIMISLKEFLQELSLVCLFIQVFSLLISLSNIF